MLDELDKLIGRMLEEGGLKAAVGWWRHDSRLEYHRDAGTFSEKTADANAVPTIINKQRLVLTSDRFGFEPEITARLAQARARIWEVSISYSGRTYAEGKKIGLKDAFIAVWAMAPRFCPSTSSSIPIVPSFTG